MSVQVGSESDPRQEPGNLPAPYVSPWLEFSRNLQAVFADLQLRAQELWRRNGEGDLSVPGFWPRNLASIFWPVGVSRGFAVIPADRDRPAGRKRARRCKARPAKPQHAYAGAFVSSDSDHAPVPA